MVSIPLCFSNFNVIKLLLLYPHFNQSVFLILKIIIKVFWIISDNESYKKYFLKSFLFNISFFIYEILS